MNFCIKNGLVFDGIVKDGQAVDILVMNGKIAEIGENLSSAEGIECIDAAGLRVYPGFVEAHAHTGLDGYAIGYEGQDYNEYNDSVTPQLRAIDGINPMDITFQKAAQAGVTCVATGPGSSNPIGGMFMAMKTVGTCVDDMVVKEVVAMKCAFGENPKRVYREKGDSSRMTTAALIRDALSKASLYLKKKEAAGDDISKQPAYDQKSEALIPVLKKEIPLKAHAHQANDLFTAVRIAKEFDLDLTLEHVTEGHLIAEELSKIGVPLAVGPTFGHATKFELQHKDFMTPGVLQEAGCQVSIITDAPVIPQENLALCAGFAVKAGMDEHEALKAITINPAKHLGIEGRVGSLEVGKDADIVITDGNPFSMETEVKYVWVDGVLVSR